MNILIIQENGRHEANRHFRECFSMQRALEKLGHHVVVWGLGHENFEDKQIPLKKYDIILNLENYDLNGWLPDISSNDSFKMLWSIDAHCRGLKPYLNTFEKGKYDVILQSTKDFLTDKSVWFPNCFDSTLIKPNNLEKTKDIGFCGSMLNREPILNMLNQVCGLEPDIWVIGQDMVDKVNSYWIHFNINLANDINYRSFETIGCSTVLLTNYNRQYEELGFVDEKNYLSYDSVESLVYKINKYLKNYDKLSKIAKEGYKLSKKHDYDTRVLDLINIYKYRRSIK